MKPFGRGSASLCLLLALLSSIELFARPRLPLAPFPEFSPPLSRIDFDQAYWAGARTNQATTVDYGDLVESWSGHALSRSGPMLAPFVLPALDAGRTNVNSQSGAVRFWFKPNWCSATVTGGTGPGVSARLLELVALAGNNAATHWSLYTDPDGSNLSLAVQTQDGPVTLLAADIAWSANSWHCLVLNYGWEGTELFIDGNLAASGPGVSGVAPADAGVVVGSTVFGFDVAEGEFDEICFFARASSTYAIALYYNTYRGTASMGPVSAEEDAARSEAITKYWAQQEQAAAMQANFGMQSSSSCVTNGPVYITNLAVIPTINQGSIVIFDIMGGTNGLLYEVFSTTNLLGTNIANATWTCLATGMTCTTFLFTNEPQVHASYVLGTPKNSDTDSLTDAYELLVSKTNPADSDTDDDGLPDDWEVAHGLNPLLNDASDDPDGDGASNLAEYNAGTNPHSTMVIAWGDNSYGQCNVPIGLRDVVSVAAGLDFSVALRSDGKLVAWGNNAYGQTNVSTLTNIAAISANWWDGLALRSNGTAVQWGGLTNLPPSSATNLTAISMGYGYGFGVKSNGTLQVWGSSIYGTNIPAHITNLSAVAAATEHGVALQRDGRVRAWGPNLCSLLGGWCTTNVPMDLTNGTAISAAYFHSLGVRNNGNVEAWGANPDGQTNTPSGLSNVIAVATGYRYSMALKADGTVAVWGNFSPTQPAYVQAGLKNVVGIASGSNHCLAIVGGRLTPFITLQPQDQCTLPGRTVVFTTAAVGAATVCYQWQFNGGNITGATNSSLLVTNAQSGNAGSYRAIIFNGAGSTNIQSATLYVSGAPVVASATQPSELRLRYGDKISLVAVATNTTPCPWLINYYWSLNGLALPLFNYTTTNYTNSFASATNDGTYAVLITNWVSYTNVSWSVKVAGEGSPIWWGSGNTTTQAWDGVAGVHDTVALAAGANHALALRDNGTVLAWGTNDYGQTNIPPGLSNVTALAAGDAHSLALKEDGRVVAWGRNDLNQTNVPTIVTNAIAISAGGHQSLALLKAGIIVQWGQTNAAIPSAATNAIAIASGTNFHIALLKKGEMVTWGDNTYGQAGSKPDLSNVVAVAAGGAHALALRSNGTVVAWGANNGGQTNVPSGLTNAMAVAAGYGHSMVLRNDGTIVAWGTNGFGQTNAPSWLTPTKLIAAGGNQSLASRFWAFTQYPVDPAKDLLLIHNTNVASVWVKDYYLAHRPMVSNANVLAIGYAPQETISRPDFTNFVRQPVLNWLAANPTKRPKYWILFLDVPSRIHAITNVGYYPPILPPLTQDNSVSYELYSTMGYQPWVTHINMDGTNDCKAYIDKVEYFGTNYCPGNIAISASAGGYGNTNYYLDYTQNGSLGPDNPGFDACAFTSSPILAVNPFASITCSSGLDTTVAHITNGMNVAGYACTGGHSSLGAHYATNGAVKFSGSSRWFIIRTVESFNGQRFQTSQGNFISWYSAYAFGATNFFSTPIGAISNSDEPGAGPSDLERNDERSYFSLWEQGHRFVVCAWKGRTTHFFQAVGDPLVRR